MRNFILLPLAGIIILLSANFQVAGQVVTRYVSPEIVKSTQHFDKIANAPLITLPSFDVSKLHEEDKLREKMRIPFRFGRKIKTDMGTECSGKWYNLENGDRIWVLRIRSKGAFSINLVFDQFKLTEGAEVYIYSLDHGVIDGPYTSEQNNPGRELVSGIVKGEEIAIQLTDLCEVSGSSKLHISSVVHGYRDVFAPNEKSGGFLDVNCPLGAGWEKESDAVVRIQIPDPYFDNVFSFCTGTLINNQTNNRKPYVLTAYHCLKLNNSYSGPESDWTPEEKAAVSNWVYYFQYRNIECDGATAYQNRKYFSSSDNFGFRAAWSHTDFALVELGQSPTHSGVTYAGWSRATSNISSTACIHHPESNPQKINVDFQSPVFVSRSDYDYPPDYFWIPRQEGGVFTGGGSSGSALFNNTKQVIGQLSGGAVADYYGRFDLSWNGPTPFNPEKSLKHWLDPNNQNPMSINSICNVPPRADIVGPDLMCANQQVSFKLNKVPLGREITWTTSPSNLLNHSTYSGDTIFTTQVLSSSSGAVTITASFYDYCGSSQKSYSKVVWIGKPSPPVIHVPQEPVNCNYNAMFWASSNPSGSTYAWQVTNGTIISQSNGEILVKPNCPPPNWTKPWNLKLQVSASNSCGSTSLTTRSIPIVNYGGPNPRLIIAPNPASVEITISEVEPTNDNIPWVLRMMSQQGAVLVNVTTTLPKTLSVAGLQAGVYVLHARREQYYEQQIVVIE